MTVTEPNASEQKPEPEEEVYSVYTHRQKQLIIISAAVGAFFSPTASQILLPALNTMGESLDVSISLISLTLTMYLIFQGISPSLMTGVADSYGRRITIITCFIIFLGANIGLALQRNYAALMVLRCLQSIGASPTVALSSALVADIVTSGERGRYMVYNMIPIIGGPSLGPIIGGLLSEYMGWPSIFWFLFICGAVYIIPIILFYPETSRTIVGNGSIKPPAYATPLWKIFTRKDKASHDNDNNNRLPRQSLNPFKSLDIVFDKYGSLLLISNGLLYANFSVVSVSLSNEFKTNYGFSDTLIGVAFLPLSGGVIMTMFLLSKVVDKNFERHAKRNGFSLDKHVQQDLTNFPIERARLEIVFPLLLLCIGTIIIYGWFLDAKIHIAGPLVVLFFMGFGMGSCLTIMNLMLFDIFPGKAGAVASANNLVRCLIGAGASAAANPMAAAIGTGWMQTFWALLWILYLPAFYVILKKGPTWRRETKEKKDQKAKEAKVDIEGP